MQPPRLPLPETFEVNGDKYQTDAETLAALRSVVPHAKARHDGTAVQAILELGAKVGRVRKIPKGPEVTIREGVEYFRDTREHFPDAVRLRDDLERAGWRAVSVSVLTDQHRFFEPEPGGGAILVTAWRLVHEAPRG